MAEKIVYLSKAGKIFKDKDIQEVHLKFCKELPNFNDLIEAAEFYDNDAQDIFENLLNVLPGGVIDRLTIKLLQHKASVFRFPYGE